MSFKHGFACLVQFLFLEMLSFSLVFICFSFFSLFPCMMPGEGLGLKLLQLRNWKIELAAIR